MLYKDKNKDLVDSVFTDYRSLLSWMDCVEG